MAQQCLFPVVFQFLPIHSYFTLGIGILALPLGFRYSGWIIGLSLFMFCSGVTNYTAKILAKCLDYDEGLYTFADMGKHKFLSKHVA